MMMNSEAMMMNSEAFVKYWANYVLTHKDEDWSRQQALLINSMIKSAQQTMTKEVYLKMKAGKSQFILSPAPA